MDGLRLLRAVLLGLVIGLLVSSYDAKAQSIEDSSYDSYIVGPINPFNALFVSIAIKNETKPVHNIYINSGGGIVFFGEIIINNIIMAKRRGVIVNCYVGDIAASMAFTILQSCSGRFAYNNTLLMQHHMYYVDYVRRVKVELREDSGNMLRLAFQLRRIKLDYRSYLKYFIDKERFFGSLEALSIDAIDEIVF